MAQKQHLSTSEFYMWRSLLAIAWADGICCADETVYFGKVFDNLSRYYDMTQEQRDALADDLLHAKDVFTLIAHINEPEPRSLLVRFAEDLVVIDGALSPEEEDILFRLHEWHQPGYDRETLQKEIQELVATRRAERAQEKEDLRAEIRSMHPLYHAVDKLLMALGIDVIS